MSLQMPLSPWDKQGSCPGALKRPRLLLRKRDRARIGVCPSAFISAFASQRHARPSIRRRMKNDVPHSAELPPKDNNPIINQLKWYVFQSAGTGAIIDLTAK